MKKSKFVMTFISILVSVITVSRAEIWAFLVAGGYEWSNYHREADVCNLYQILRANNVSKENIIVMMADTIAFHAKNPLPGVIQYYPDGPNVYEDVIIDYAGENVTANNFLRVLSGDTSSTTNGTGRVIQSNKDDTILLYISSIGWYQTLWINSGQYVRTTAFFDALTHLKKTVGFDATLIFLEANRAAAFLDNELLLTNIGAIGLATTTTEQPAVCYENDVLNINGHASCYSSIWTRLLQRVGIDTRKGIVNLFDYFQITREKFPETVADLYGQLDIGTYSVRHFFGPKKLTDD